MGWWSENFGSLGKPRPNHWFEAYERLRLEYNKLTQDIADRKLVRVECEDGTYLVKYEKVEVAQRDT